MLGACGGRRDRATRGPQRLYASLLSRKLRLVGEHVAVRVAVAPAPGQA